MSRKSFRSMKPKPSGMFSNEDFDRLLREVYEGTITTGRDTSDQAKELLEGSWAVEAVPLSHLEGRRKREVVWNPVVWGESRVLRSCAILEWVPGRSGFVPTI